MRNLLVALAALALAAPAAAQHQHGQQPARPVRKDQPAHAAQHGQAPDHSQYPAGWAVRVDRDASREQVWLMDHGNELHAATGPAGAVYYNADWTESGDYEYAARFRQPKASEHPEAYGLIIGGSGLAGADQRYSYFLIRQTGEYFVADRKGEVRTKVVDWTPHAAIRKLEGAAPAENVLGVRVQGDEVVFSVNGQEVARRPKSELSTDGLTGFRVNHNLEVFIDQVQR